MLKSLITIIVVSSTLIPFTAASAQEQPPAAPKAYDGAAADIRRQLEASLAELDKLSKEIAAEKIPLNRTLSDLEGDLVNVRQEYQQASRLLDTRTLDLNNLRTEIKARHDETSYLSNLLGEYIRNFESGIHIVELQRYRKELETAKLAAENTSLSEQEVFKAQATMLSASLDRLHDLLGGARFDGTAVDQAGLVKQGTFVLVGPAAFFRSADGANVGTAEQRLGSLEPSIIPFSLPADTQTASQLVSSGKGSLVLDPTLGSAHKIESTEETLVEHIIAGGPVMAPIIGLGALAALVALFKWLSLSLVRKPSQKRVKAVLACVAQRNKEGAMMEAKRMGGPSGRMVRAGIEHLGEPKELIEETMFEVVMATRLKLQRMLPFLAISTASAPLLGLLGTVTGIITTFKLITVYGSGDVKTLSGGISEALITTEWGLMVAIPCLLIHAWLTRKARGIVDQMEKVGVAMINQITKAYEVDTNAVKAAA